MFDLDRWASERRELVNASLHSLFEDAWPGDFGERLRYPLFTGGKRVRPLLTFAAYEAVAEVVAPITQPSPRAALHAATAVELLHTYSLVHDDMPDMDNDDERRGRPTVHVAYDPATAILVGDALLTEAFNVLSRDPAPADVRIQLVSRLASAGGYLGMIGGQAADIGIGGPVEDVDSLIRLHKGKTGALIEVSVAMGGIIASAAPSHRDALATYGHAVGLAFQLADDVLDADEDAGDDGPPSYVKLLGLDETRRRARELAQEATDAAKTLPRPDALLALARFIVERDI